MEHFAEFWFALVFLGVGAIWAIKRIPDGLGLPVLVVLGTVGVWYFVDVFYNDYSSNFAFFTDAVVQSAWLQVALFLATFLIIVAPVNHVINGRKSHLPSHVIELAKSGVDNTLLQKNLRYLLVGAALVWTVLAIAAIMILRGRSSHYFFPYLDYVLSPWSRPRVGSGFDSVRSLALYLNMFTAVIFGLVAALAENGKVRNIAFILCFLAWPFFLFNRARSSMIVVVLPAILAWVFLRVRGGVFKKALLLAGFFLLTDLWFGLIIQTRSFMPVAQAIQEEGLSIDRIGAIDHAGLNMFEELSWINKFFNMGALEASWGQGYFAELVNPIPRALWSGKPLISIEYSILRGQAGGSFEQAGVFATMATGLIGGGVVNFGPLLGPPFAALLMSLWVGLLVRLDKDGDKLGRLALYALGIAITFNLGRDVTFITLYTFVFGAGLVWWLDRWQGQKRPSKARVGRVRR